MITESVDLSSHIDFFSRAQGALLGLALGDALGTTLEFQPKDTFEPITDLCGGGPFNLQAGQWTDDTSMALCLADSLLSCQGHNAKDQVERYIRWRDTGYNSPTGRCFDIGNTVSESLRAYEKTHNPGSGLTNEYSAGNGSIMRLAPIVIFYSQHKGHTPDQIQSLAVQSSLTTHGEEQCVEACKILAYLLNLIIFNELDKRALIDNVLATFPIDEQRGKGSNKLRRAIEKAADAETTRDEIFGRGYVVDSLQAAVWCFLQTNSFAEGALLAANLGDDADTTAAIYGQIAGAHYGLDALPVEWLEKLAWRETISETAIMLALYDNSPDSNRMYFKFKKPEQVVSLDDENLSEEQQGKNKQRCPTLDLSMPQTYSTLLDHIQEFFRYTFDIPTLSISGTTNIYEDLDRLYYSLDDDSEATNGRLFCDKNGNGGMSDRGLVAYLTLCHELPDTMGIDGKNSEIEGYDLVIDGLDSEWKTVGEFIETFLEVNRCYLAKSS